MPFARPIRLDSGALYSLSIVLYLVFHTVSGKAKRFLYSQQTLFLQLVIDASLTQIGVNTYILVDLRVLNTPTEHHSNRDDFTKFTYM
jgi:hypothetical protein